MNEHEAQRIAAAMHVLRPDWPTASILTMIRKNLIDRPRRDVTVALSWIACEANSHTPARVLESGPWWIAVGVDGTTTNRPGKVDKADRCGICSEARDRCERIWANDHTFDNGQRDPIDVHRTVAALKTELAPIATLTEPTGLDALTDRRPELAQAADQIAAANPGLRNGKREDGMSDDDEFIQCPHEAIKATCAGGCNCPCDPCAPSRETWAESLRTIPTQGRGTGEAEQ